MTQMQLPMAISGLPLDLRSLAADIHQGNIDAGWWKKDAETGRTLNRNVGEMLALVHSEISEADHGFEMGLMDDKLPHRRMVEVEQADVAIRVLDMLGFYADYWGEKVAPDERRYIPLPLPEFASWDEWCRLMHRTTTVALEGFRKGDIPKGVTALDGLLGVVHFCSIMFNYDLTGAIAEKREFNRNRADHKLENRVANGGKAF